MNEKLLSRTTELISEIHDLVEDVIKDPTLHDTEKTEILASTLSTFTVNFLRTVQAGSPAVHHLMANILRAHIDASYIDGEEFNEALKHTAEEVISDSGVKIQVYTSEGGAL